jgi:hypothetical protein
MANLDLGQKQMNIALLSIAEQGDREFNSLPRRAMK